MNCVEFTRFAASFKETINFFIIQLWWLFIFKCHFPWKKLSRRPPLRSQKRPPLRPSEKIKGRELSLPKIRKTSLWFSNCFSLSGKKFTIWYTRWLLPEREQWTMVEPYESEFQKLLIAAWVCDMYKAVSSQAVCILTRLISTELPANWVHYLRQEK